MRHCSVLLLWLATVGSTLRHSARMVLDFRATGQGNSATPHVVLGNFSQMGVHYNLQADVVQVHPFRACQLGSKGPDTTLVGHVAVIFMDELEPFIAGCVSLDNQAKFARDSGASAVIIGPVPVKATKAQESEMVDIPVITLHALQSLKLKHLLAEASSAGYIVQMDLSANTPQQTNPANARFRPNIFDLGVFLALIILVGFASVVVFIKVKWRPRTHREITLHTLAKTALSSMEIRKFRRASRYGRPFYQMRNKDFPKAAAFEQQLCTSKLSVISSHEMCAICLEDYRDGQDLRVLFCGHEFHQKCVDPWLLAKRTCPLCQFDVVYQQYPIFSEPKPADPMVECLELESTQAVALPLLPEERQTPEETVRNFLEQFLSAPSPVEEPPTSVQVCALSAAKNSKRRRSRSRRRPKHKEPSGTPAPALLKLTVHETLTDGGYLSDISSLDTVREDINRNKHFACRTRHQQRQTCAAASARCKEFRVFVQDGCVPTSSGHNSPDLPESAQVHSNNKEVLVSPDAH